MFHSELPQGAAAAQRPSLAGWRILCCACLRSVVAAWLLICSTLSLTRRFSLLAGGRPHDADA